MRAARYYHMQFAQYNTKAFNSYHSKKMIKSLSISFSHSQRRVSATNSGGSCQGGHYRPQIDADVVECQPVGPGHYSPEDSIYRFPCWAGSFAANTTTSTNCTSCNAGSYSQSKASYCELCPSGTFNVLPGASSCQPCNTTYYSGSGSDGVTVFLVASSEMSETISSPLYCLEPQGDSGPIVPATTLAPSSAANANASITTIPTTITTTTMTSISSPTSVPSLQASWPTSSRPTVVPSTLASRSTPTTNAPPTIPSTIATRTMAPISAPTNVPSLQVLWPTASRPTVVFSTLAPTVFASQSAGGTNRLGVSQSSSATPHKVLLFLIFTVTAVLGLATVVFLQQRRGRSRRSLPYRKNLRATTPPRPPSSSNGASTLVDQSPMSVYLEDDV